MKKILSLVMLSCITLVSLAAPWDLGKKRVNVNWGHRAKASMVEQSVKPFTDPYCDYYFGSITGTWPAQTFHLQATLDHSGHVPWLVQIQVFGVWRDEPGYPNAASYKLFSITYSSAEWNKTVHYSLLSSEEAYPGVMDLLYDGPQ